MISILRLSWYIISRVLFCFSCFDHKNLWVLKWRYSMKLHFSDYPPIKRLKWTHFLSRIVSHSLKWKLGRYRYPVSLFRFDTNRNRNQVAMINYYMTVSLTRVFQSKSNRNVALHPRARSAIEVIIHALMMPRPCPCPMTTKRTTPARPRSGR